MFSLQLLRRLPPPLRPALLHLEQRGVSAPHILPWQKGFVVIVLQLLGLHTTGQHVAA